MYTLCYLCFRFDIRIWPIKFDSLTREKYVTFKEILVCLCIIWHAHSHVAPKLVFCYLLWLDWILMTILWSNHEKHVFLHKHIVSSKRKALAIFPNEDFLVCLSHCSLMSLCLNTKFSCCTATRSFRQRRQTITKEFNKWIMHTYTQCVRKLLNSIWRSALAQRDLAKPNKNHNSLLCRQRFVLRNFSLLTWFQHVLALTKLKRRGFGQWSVAGTSKGLRTLLWFSKNL